MAKTEVLHMRISESIKDMLQEIASATGQSMTSVVLSYTITGLKNDGFSIGEIIQAHGKNSTKTVNETENPITLNQTPKGL